MLSKYIQVPYIETSFGLATPALIISITYLLVLGLFLLFAVKKGMLKVSIINVCKLMRGDQNSIITSMLGYVVFILSCIFLPDFLGAENIILTVSETYLQFEPLTYVLLFVFLCTAFLNGANRETQINATNCIFRYLIWISLGTGILYGQLDYMYWKNIVVIICSWVINGLFFIIDIQTIPENSDNPAKFDLIPYGAVKGYHELFPSHKRQAEDIVSIISSSSPDPFSICLSGEWGTGKTSVINGVVELLKQQNEKAYDFIYINALELDDKKTVLTYLMAQIREKLKSRGVYVGINSEYKEFVSSFAGSLTSDAIGTFLQSKLSNDEDDYRVQKQNLEAILERTYKNGKLIVVVDDIERCDRNIAREYLFLIKEVATMRSCVSVFVTDYNMLNRIISIETAATSHPDFLNKFFNYKIDLEDEAPADMLAFYDSYFNQEYPAFGSIYKVICKSPGTWYNDAVAGLTTDLHELEKDKRRYQGNNEDRKAFEQKAQEQKECLSLFIKSMHNPRNIAKFYNAFRNRALQCGKYLRFSSNYNEASKYISSRNIGHVLYFISYVEVFLPAEYERLKKQGPRYIDPLFYGIKTIESVSKRLLVELAQGLIFGGYYEFGRLDGYIKEDIKKFIKHFLSGNTDLYQLINPFTSQEEEWLNAISETNHQQIKMHWVEMVLMVLQKIPNEDAGITNSWRNEKFLFLLEFAEEQVKTGVWTSDKLFSLFDRDLHIDRYWSLSTGLMQTFWNHVDNSTVYKKPSKERADDFNIFLYHYAYARTNTIYKLMHYLIPMNNNVKTDSHHEYLLDSTSSLGQNLAKFLKKVEGIIPNFSFKSEGWYDNLKELSKHIHKYLANYDIADYSDMKEDILHMLDTAEELQCLEKLAVWIAGEEKVGLHTLMLENYIENIDPLIDYFEKGFAKLSSDNVVQREFEKEFTNFFIKLQQSEGLTLTKEQSTRLHQLVESFSETFGLSTLPYRRTILNIPEAHK